VTLTRGRWRCVASLVGATVGCGASAAGTTGADAADADAALVLTPVTDATATTCDDGGAPPVGFITKVVSFTPGACAGFGQSAMPCVVYGPPVGAGPHMGSRDVVSLGKSGEIVVGFAPDMIIDGPGADFIVFENAFDGPDGSVFAEPGEVSVSDDLVHWSVFPCTQTTQEPPYGQCAGVHPVFSTPGGISPFDAADAGGDAYDLADLPGGVRSAKYVRIRDVVTSEACTSGNSYGFDLDAISVVNGSVAAQ
jgi:hypothetical protein